MTGSLFLAPATPRNGAYEIFEQTVLTGIPRKFYRDYTDADYGDPARLWGLVPTQSTTWSHIEPGDWVLFYTAMNEYRHAAQVRCTEHNPELGDDVRTKQLGMTEEDLDHDWTNLIFFEDPIRVDISGGHVADLLDYSNSFPNRFTRVVPDRLNRLEREYRSLDAFITDIREK